MKTRNADHKHYFQLLGRERIPSSHVQNKSCRAHLPQRGEKMKDTALSNKCNQQLVPKVCECITLLFYFIYICTCLLGESWCVLHQQQD